MLRFQLQSQTGGKKGLFGEVFPAGAMLRGGGGGGAWRRNHPAAPCYAEPQGNAERKRRSAGTKSTCRVCSSFPKRPGTSSTSSPGRSHEAGPRGASSFLPSKSRCCLCRRALGSGAELWLCAAGWMLSSSLLKPGELAALRQSSFQLSKLSF